MRKLLILMALAFATGCDPCTTIEQVEANAEDQAKSQSQQDEAWETMDKSIGLQPQSKRRNAWDTGPIQWELKDEK
jgi:hypothetical protein